MDTTQHPDTTSGIVALVARIKDTPFDRLTPVQMATIRARITGLPNNKAIVENMPFTSAI